MEAPPTTTPKTKKRRGRTQKAKNSYRDAWIHQERGQFTEYMTNSEHWEQAYLDGSVEQKLEWVREADKNRTNWEPVYNTNPGVSEHFMCGRRTTTQQTLPELEETHEVWERELADLAEEFEKCELEEETTVLTEMQVNELSREVMTFINIISPELTLAEKQLIVEQLFDVTGTHHTPGPRDAMEWAGGFELPDSVVQQDLDIFEECNWDWEAIVEKKRGPQRKDRLSVERVEKAISKSSQDKDRLKVIAKGIKVPVDPLWKSNHDAEYPECSTAYKQVAPAVTKIFHDDYWIKGQGFYMNMESSRRLKVNTSVASWTPKYGKVKGRPISNHSRVSPGMEKALNSLHVKEVMEQEWGKIKHPTIAVIIRMILAYERDHPDVPREDLMLWSCDLKGAFTLMDIFWEDVKKLGLVMGPDLVWVTIVAGFGWTGTPFCFDVITRLCRTLLSKHFIDSYHNWFVDDGLGCGRRSRVERDYAKVIAFIESLLGRSAVAEEKKAMGRVLAFIGYLLDLDNWTVSVKPSNLVKTLRGFFSIDINISRLTLKDTQRLASWASRYGQVCPYLTPFVRILWQEVKKRHGWGIHADDILTEQGKGAVSIIRSILLGSMLRNKTLTRSLDSFGKKGYTTVVCEYDACLTGIGVVWYRVENGFETPVGAGSWCTRSMGFDRDSQYQNKSEFIAGLIAIMGLQVLKLSRDSVQLRGDSMTALDWSHSWSFKGQDMVKEALVFVHCVMQKEVTMVKPQHIPAEENEFTDALSRRFEPGNCDKRLNPNRSINDICQQYKAQNLPFVNWDLAPLWDLFNRELDWSMEGMGKFWKGMIDRCVLLDESVSVSH